MAELKIKQEFSSFGHQCYSCLSVGRKLSPLGEYTNIFRMLLSDYDCPIDELLNKIQLCWECVAVLRKVHLFQQQLKKVYTAYLGPEYIYGSLSTLTSITLNDSLHIVYVYDTVVPTAMNIENVEQIDDDDDDGLQGDDEIKSEEIIDVVKEPQKPKNNLWASKRVQQNKKPKFKIITGYTETLYHKKEIKHQDIYEFMKRKRESECFKANKFKCFSCVLVFSDKKSMDIHNDMYHKKPTPYICDICGSNLKDKRHLSTHISKHNYKYACPLCTYETVDKCSIKIHYKKYHKKIFECIKCKLKFGNRKDFFKHYKEWHEKFICDYCGVSFKMRYCIKNHIRKQHSPFVCKPCNKTFARYNGLWLHNKTVHSTSKTTAYCVECDKKYPDIYRYKWHLANSARHNKRNKSRVPCPGCDKVFSKNIYMRDHYNLVHLKYYKYRCEQCDKNFIRNADLVKHTRRVHEGILPPKDKICYMCGRGFSTNKILKNHVRTHTGERPHVCVICGARFAQHTTLLAHTRALHHGNTPPQ